ncbi:MAG: hypothetical protein AAB953_01795 [Patescibacteria group bacterium]
MAFKVNHKSLFIGDEKNIFVENYSYDQLFITIEIRNNLSNAKAIGEKIWSTMRRYFFAKPNEEFYKKFKDSLKEVNEVLANLHTNDLSVLLGFIAGKDLYLAQMGDAVAYLAHNNSIEVISQGLSGEGGCKFTNVAKGKIEVGDFVVFSSVSLFEYISRADLTKVLNASALTDSLAKLNELISTKISGKAGIIGMTFEKTPELIKEVSIKEALINRTVTVIKKLPHKLLAKLLKIKIPKINIPKIKIPKIKIPKIEIKTPKFLSNIINFVKNLFLSMGHRIGMTFEKISELIKEAVAVTKKLPHKWLGIFVVVILILGFGGVWYAKNSALIREQVSTAVIKGQDDKKVTETVKVTETILDEAANIRQVENPKVFVDFSTRQPNVNPIGLLALKDKFFTFEQNKLYGIGLDKIEELATFEGSETIVSATDFEDQDSLIFITKSGKLIQYKNGSVTFVKTADGEFHSGIAIDDWGDRIYILDPDKNQIWRYYYLSAYDTFGSANGYNVDNNSKDVIDFVVDGLIYILHKDASIDQLYKGLQQDFSIQNEPLTEFKTPSKIYTESGLSRIFVMDSSASRIFMYAKDLETGNAIYDGQLVFPTISGLRDLYVDKNANKLYLLDAQKVYEVQL